MDKSGEITLEKQTFRTDALKQRVPDKPEQRTVFCRINSVSRSEWSSAAQSGLKAAYRVTVWADEYHGETVAILDDVRYGIYRTYQPNADEIELYLERKVGA